MKKGCTRKYLTEKVDKKTCEGKSKETAKFVPAVKASLSRFVLIVEQP